MKLLKAFEDPALVRSLAQRIRRLAENRGNLVFMEVCGTHTHAIGRWALRELLSDSIRLVSGPGCPVCVTPGQYIDQACRLAVEHGAIVTTFGDLLRVPGNETSLETARADGADVRIVGSPLDAMTLAESTEREVVFLAIGFETTIASIAAAVRQAIDRKIPNLTFFCSLRLVPPALRALLADPDIRLDGFLLPGHVSAIIGAKPYAFLSEHGIPGAIAGFEPADILAGVEALLRDAGTAAPAVRNLYARVVKEDGNRHARALFDTLFDIRDENWRGIGTIPQSGYGLKPEFAAFDTQTRFGLPASIQEPPTACECGNVLKGRIVPPECPLFGTACTPDHPVGPCMVSPEGSCSAYLKYGR